MIAQRRTYDTKSSDNTYKVGDPVWLYNPKRKKGISPKLSRNWEGPYTVVKRINDLVYRIQLGPRTKPKVVHWNRLWCYKGDNPPQWLGQSGTQAKSVEMAVNPDVRVEPDADNRDLEPNEQDKSTESREDGGLRRSTRARKPPTRYNPANT